MLTIRHILVFLIGFLGICVVHTRSVIQTTGTIFNVYPRKVELLPNQSLTLLWKHTMQSSDIRWCSWQYRPLEGGNDWEKFLGYDNEHSQPLNISERYKYYRFIEDDRPCQNGIWSPDIELKNVVGFYRMMLISANGSTFTSSMAEVTTKQACAACPPPVVCPESATVVCEVCDNCKRAGLIVAVVFLMLLIAGGVAVIILYWKGKIPEKVLSQVNMKPRKYEREEKVDPESQRFLMKYEVVDLKEAVTKLEESLEKKDEEMDKEKDALQSQVNRIRQESTYHKQTVEAKEAEISQLQEELNALREQYDHHQNELIETKEKLKEAEKRASTVSEKAPHFVRNIGKTLTSFRASKHDDRIKRPTFANGGMSDWKAVFAEPLKDVDLKPNEDLKLSVKVKEEGTEVKWFRYGVNIDKSSDVDIQKGQKDHNKIKLKMKKKTMNIPGVYKCEGKFGAISRTVDATVTVVEGDNESPVFLRWIGDTKYATDGTRAELSVTVKGNPINGPAWYLNNKRIESRDHRKIETSTDNSGNKISKIILDPCCPNDGGDYHVIADNKLGKTKCGAKLIILDAKSAPQFISGLRHRKVKPGDTVMFSVTVVGSPQPKVEWTNNREFINEYDHVDITDVVENGRLTSKLTIHNVSDVDEGLISVTARNDVSSTFCDAQLTLDKT